MPRRSISGGDWLPIKWDLFERYRSDRDYFIWDLKNEKEFSQAPISYSRGLSWLKNFTLLQGLADLNEIKVLELAVRQITWHSMRVTMLSEAVKARVDDKIVGMQANCALQFVVEGEGEIVEPVLTESFVRAA